MLYMASRFKIHIERTCLLISKLDYLLNEYKQIVQLGVTISYFISGFDARNWWQKIVCISLFHVYISQNNVYTKNNYFKLH